MASEKWVSTEVVPPKDLVPWLKKMKQHGYSLVGAEQVNDYVHVR